MVNKNKFSIRNTKKVLHKVGKQWVVVSAVLLGLIAGGTAVTTTTQANADVSVNHATPLLQGKAQKADQIAQKAHTKADMNTVMNGVDNYVKSNASATSNYNNLLSLGSKAPEFANGSGEPLGSDNATNSDANTWIGFFNDVKSNLNSIYSANGNNNHASLVNDMNSKASSLYSGNVSAESSSLPGSIDINLNSLSADGYTSVASNLTSLESSAVSSINNVLNTSESGALKGVVSANSMALNGSAKLSNINISTNSASLNSIMNNGSMSASASAMVTIPNISASIALNSFNASSVASNIMSNAYSAAKSKANSEGSSTANEKASEHAQDLVNMTRAAGQDMSFNDAKATLYSQAIDRIDSEAVGTVNTDTKNGTLIYGDLNSLTSNMNSYANNAISSALTSFSANGDSYNLKTSGMPVSASVVATLRNNYNISDIAYLLDGKGNVNNLVNIKGLPINVNEALHNAVASVITSKAANHPNVSSDVSLVAADLRGLNEINSSADMHTEYNEMLHYASSLPTQTSSQSNALNSLADNSNLLASSFSSDPIQYYSGTPENSTIVSKLAEGASEANSMATSMSNAASSIAVNASNAQVDINNIKSDASYMSANKDSLINRAGSTNYSNASDAINAYFTSANNALTSINNQSASYSENARANDTDVSNANVDLGSANTALSNANSTLDSVAGLTTVTIDYENGNNLVGTTTANVESSNGTNIPLTNVPSHYSINNRTVQYNGRSVYYVPVTPENIVDTVKYFDQANPKASFANGTVSGPYDTIANDNEFTNVPNGYQLANDGSQKIVLNGSTYTVDVVASTNGGNNNSSANITPAFNPTSTSTSSASSSSASSAQPATTNDLAQRALAYAKTPKEVAEVLEGQIPANIMAELKGKATNNNNNHSMNLRNHYRYVKVTKALQLHTNAKFTKRNGVKVVQPGTEFRIDRIVKNNGLTRYEVRYQGHDYFITANAHYAENAYLQKNNFRKHGYKAVRAIKNFNEYKKLNFAKRSFIRKFRRGAVLPVRRVITIANGKMTRLQLTNGRYVTANKNFVEVIK